MVGGMLALAQMDANLFFGRFDVESNVSESRGGADGRAVFAQTFALGSACSAPFNEFAQTAAGLFACRPKLTSRSAADRDHRERRGSRVAAVALTMAGEASNLPPRTSVPRGPLH